MNQTKKKQNNEMEQTRIKIKKKNINRVSY